MLVSKIAIVLYILDMWSVLFSYAGGEIKFSDRTYVPDMWSVLCVPYVGVGI